MSRHLCSSMMEVRPLMNNASMLVLLLLASSTTFEAFHVASPATSFRQRQQRKHQEEGEVVSGRTYATVASSESSSSSSSLPSFSMGDYLTSVILEQMKLRSQIAKEYSQMFGLSSPEVGFYSVFDAIRQSNIALGLKGHPFVIRKNDITNALDVEDNTSPFASFFTIDDLEKALEDDFLDASRGSTDNRKGWKITTVSNPRGDSFEEARMTFEDVQLALEKGTVIFNAAGAHIPKLAGPCLACTDATSTPNALNIYITAAGKRTSAPPHTDKQDVLVVQCTGSKHWKVYAPPNPALKPEADVFARGKGDDNLPIHKLDESGDLRLETTTNPGDIMFIPAGFPHTTSTVVVGDDDQVDNDAPTSLHLTFNIDTHVWDLDYLSVRRMALRRACLNDPALGQSREEDNRYVGKCNELRRDVHEELFAELPLGFLDDDDNEQEDQVGVEDVTSEVIRISEEVDPETALAVDETTWKETVSRVRQQGQELLEIHRDMYLAAIEEGRVRDAEDAMTAHLDKNKDDDHGHQQQQHRRAMTPERMQRLSLFRVQRYYEKINQAKADLVAWSYSGTPPEATTSPSKTKQNDNDGSYTKTVPTLPENWAFTMPIKVGDQVEADLGGAFFPATVTKVGSGGRSFDVQFFDGDKEAGLERGMLKLMVAPKLAGDDDVDTSNMTPKQLKRWKKEQEKRRKGK